jgi:hypothetical protein
MHAMVDNIALDASTGACVPDHPNELTCAHTHPLNEPAEASV